MPGFQSPSDYEHIKDFHEGAPTEANAFLSFKAPPSVRMASFRSRYAS
jgi:hypothetical protein